jgi:2-polyprenyl-6-methoxyphenol hydroxylase-like FAD-dependent oxidoreductase
MSPKSVIIVGSGPVGPPVALELARFDVPTVVLEQHDSTSRARQAGVNRKSVVRYLEAAIAVGLSRDGGRNS